MTTIRSSVGWAIGLRRLPWPLPDVVYLRPVLAAALLIISCSPQPPLQSVFDHALQLDHEGKASAAVAELDQGLRRTNNDKSSIWYWRFLVQKAQFTRATLGPRSTLDSLGGEPPKSPGFEEIRARRKWCQAWCELNVGSQKVAETELEEGLQLATQARSPEMMSRIEVLQGFVLSRSQQFPEAEKKIQSGLRNATASHDPDVIDASKQALAAILSEEARYEECLAIHEQRRIEFERTGNGRKLVPLYSEMGICAMGLGEQDLAMDLYTRGENLSRVTGQELYLEAFLGNIGAVYMYLDKNSVARPYFEQALEISNRLREVQMRASWFANLARITALNREWDLANHYATEAARQMRESKNKNKALHVRISQAHILEGTGKFAEAEKLYRETAADCAAGPDGDFQLLEAYSGLAKLYASQSQDGKAVEAFETALKSVDQVSKKIRADQVKVEFIANAIRASQEYVEFLMSRNRPEQALEIAEASRSKILRQRLGYSDSTQRLNAATYRRMARESGQTILSYWLGPKRSFAWLITPDRITAHELPSAEQIEELVLQYGALIQKMRNPLELDEGTAPALFKALLGPVSASIKPGTRLLIVPDRSLNALNFETVLVPSPKPHYLIEDATVAVAPSLSLMADTTTKPRQQKRLLLIGDPVFQDPHYAELPYAGQEMQLVSRHFDSSRVSQHQRLDATPEAYEKAAGSGFDYIHFTAHANAVSATPLESAIMLTGPGGIAKLTAANVIKKPIDAGLVTISACRGAGAKSYAGEGLVGFVWAFFQAGARNIVAGLWDVADDSTPRLMDRFYAELTRGEAPARALRTAKLELMRSSPVYSRPFYWAPFQLYTREIESH